MRTVNNGHGKVLCPIEPQAQIVIEALEGFASGYFASRAEVKCFLQDHGDKPIYHVHPVVAAGIGLDQRSIRPEVISSDQTLRHAAGQHRVQQVAKKIVLTEPEMSVFGEDLMIGNGIAQTKPAEPTISRIQMDFGAKPPL